MCGREVDLSTSQTGERAVPQRGDLLPGQEPGSEDVILDVRPQESLFPTVVGPRGVNGSTGRRVTSPSLSSFRYGAGERTVRREVRTSRVRGTEEVGRVRDARRYPEVPTASPTHVHFGSYFPTRNYSVDRGHFFRTTFVLPPPHALLQNGKSNGRDDD